MRHSYFPIGKFKLPFRCAKNNPDQDNFILLALDAMAQTVRSTRKRLKLRQDQLAASAGVGVRFLVELEAGKASAQLGKTLAVLEALGLDVCLKPRQTLDPDADR